MWRKLGIEPGEGRIFAWGALALFLVGWTDVSMKNVSETLFLKRIGVDYIPLAFLANSILLVGTTWAIGRVAAVRDRLKLLPRTMFGLAAALLPLWLLVKMLPEAPVLLVLASKQLTSVTLLVFWIAMGDLLHGRQAKRLFAPMMAGVTLGTMLGSFASDPIARAVGIDGLLPISAVILAAGGLVTLPLRRLRPRLEPTVAARRRPDGAVREEAPIEVSRGAFVHLWDESPLFRLLFVTALCSGLLGPMLYFQFSYVADLATAGEESLLAFYSQFRGWISGGILIVQLAVAGNLYRRIGVPLSAALSPLIYLLGFLGLSVRLSLGAGVGAMAGTKLQDNAVYDPALRVLYNLFPEETRSRASALLEGPVKRAGGAVGNAVSYLAVQLASALWVGYAAVPIAAAWLVGALILWKRYPRLLLEASAARPGEELGGAELLDPTTLRALAPELRSADPERCRVAVELVSEAKPELAVAALAEAAIAAPPATRRVLLNALDVLLERAVRAPFHSADAAAAVETLLREGEELSVEERTILVQANGRLSPPGGGEELLAAGLDDPAPAVRLAALAALHRRGAAPDDAEPLDEVLRAALFGDDAWARRTAREEYRALLLAGPETDGEVAWEERLARLCAALEDEAQRADAAEALAEVAVACGERAAQAHAGLLALREEPEPRLRAALLRYSGHARLREQAGWLIEHLASDEPSWAEAAQDGLRALGSEGSDTLLRELAYGKRSKREGILEVLREVEVQPETLRALYESELDGVSRDLRYLVALRERAPLALLSQRLEERVREELHTALLFLAAIRHEARIAELGERLELARGWRRRHAILLEALEALLPPQEKARLVPLLESDDIDSTALTATRRGVIPTADEALHALMADPEELTRTIATGLAVASGIEVEDHDGVDAVEKTLHLRGIPLFEGLSARQLMDLARLTRERELVADTVVVRQGDFDDCLYLVVEGVIHVVRGETLLAEMGPGDFFGEIALFEGTARTATVMTRSQARLLLLERGDLLHLIEDLPGIAVVLLQTLSRRVRELTERLNV